MSVRAAQKTSPARQRPRTDPHTARLAPPSLLAPPGVPKVAQAALGRTADLDAILVILPVAAAKGLLEGLPETQRWQELHARSTPRAATVRTTVLSNKRHTLAVLGYMGAEASIFERLSLAARMLKESAARGPEALGLLALGENPLASLEALLAASLAHAFHLPAYRAPAPDERRLRSISLLGAAADRNNPAAKLDLPYALAAARGNNLVRWLTALPPNLLDARGYHDALSKLSAQHGIGMRWLDEPALRRAGAGAFLAVASGNEGRDAGIAHLSYRPARTRKVSRPDIALVGKGILFDTGGVNLKPHRSMLDMHTDMSGSAVALATLLALAELRVPLCVDAWLAITENQIGPKAYRPQEVVRAANGVTIQVIHTDAEGRMVLADTLALASRTQPRFMLDFATLTGAAVYSLTERMSAVLTNRPALAPKLVDAGRSSGERVWNFPLDADYDSDLESKVADVMQCAVEGKGDHILASRFLSRFVAEKIPWAHVDLSAATRTGGLGHINTEITGFGVRYALELILRQDILAAVEGVA